MARKLIASGIIPPVGAGRGLQIVRLILHYGFLLGVLVIVLGFGLKYRAISGNEQKAAIKLLVTELQHNLHVANELKKNTATPANAATEIAESFRIARLKINFALFPAENIDPAVEQNADLYHQRFEWLKASGLLSDKEELRRFSEQNAAIKRMIERTISTVRSLGDRQAARYVINQSAYHANLPMLSKLTIVEPQKLSGLYAKTSQVREEYFRVAETVEEYLLAALQYCKSDTPDRTALAAVLAAERLTVRLLDDQKAGLEKLAGDLQKQATGFTESLAQPAATTIF